MTLRAQIAAVRRHVLCRLHRRIVALGELGPIVTFTFDDFPQSALTVGGNIIEAFGGRSTYYVAMGLVGTSNSLGMQCSSADAYSVAERGHELASHTFSHPSARKTRPTAFLADVDRCEAEIREQIGVTPSHNFAYPFGDVTLRMKSRLGPRMRSCRGTFGGFNGPDVDLNLLRANSLYGGIGQSEAAKKLILENERRKSWLIFYSHDVADNPSPFGCTPALLADVVSFAVSRSAKLMTVAVVVNALCGATETPILQSDISTFAI